MKLLRLKAFHDFVKEGKFTMLRPYTGVSIMARVFKRIFNEFFSVENVIHGGMLTTVFFKFQMYTLVHDEFNFFHF